MRVSSLLAAACVGPGRRADSHSLATMHAAAPHLVRIGIGMQLADRSVDQCKLSSICHHLPVIGSYDACMGTVVPACMPRLHELVADDGRVAWLRSTMPLHHLCNMHAPFKINFRVPVSSIKNKMEI